MKTLLRKSKSLFLAILFLLMGYMVQASKYNVTAVAISAQPTIPTYGTAGSSAYTITLTEGGNGNPGATTNLSITITLPSGVTTSFPISNLALTGSGQTVTLTITSTSSSPAGSTNFTVTSSSGPVTSATATFVIKKRSLNFTGTKTYDGTTTFTSAQLTAGNIVNSDAVTLGGSATGSSKNIGTYTSFSTNSLTSSNANYIVTGGTVSVSITAKPLTITNVTANGKVYNGTTIATLNTGTATLSGVVGGDAVTLNSGSATGTFSNKNVGTGKTATTSGFTISGVDAGNYSLAQPTTTANITARPLTITGAANTKIEDGTTSSATNPAITSGVVQTGDVAAFTQTYDTKNVGTSKVMTPAGVVTDGNSGNNYTYTFVTSSNGTITATSTTTSVASNNNPGCFNSSVTFTATIVANGNAATGTVEFFDGLTSLGTSSVSGNQATLTLSSLSAGSHSITAVYSGDADDNTSTSSAITQSITALPAAFSVTGGGTRCSNGAVLPIDLSGSESGVNYQLYNGASADGSPVAGTGASISFTATNAGTYKVVATDATTGCKNNMTGSATINVNAAPTLTYTKVFASSCNKNDGSISVTASGGASPYSYSWTTVGGFTASTPDITGLVPDDYTVVVTDNNVCSTTIPGITIKLAPAPSVGLSSKTNPGCATNDGTISAFRIGGIYDGINPIQYQLAGDATVSYQNSGSFTGLSAGNYTVTVKDSKGCTGVSSPIVLSQSAPLSFTPNGYNTNVSACGGGSDGSTTVTVTGGVDPYHYILNGVEQKVTSLKTYTISGLTSGVSYTVSVTDSKGCSISKSVTLTQEAIPTALVPYKGNVTCIGGNDGFITAWHSGGVPGYNYSKDGGATYQSSYRFLNLTAGNYSIVIKDSKGCISAPVAVTIADGTKSCTSGRVGNTSNTTIKNRSEISNENSSLSKSSFNSSLSIQAYPNPFGSEFTLNVQGNNQDRVSITITDVSGRRLYQAEGNANQQYKLGRKLGRGIYIVQVMQGENVQTIKVVKE